MRRGISWKAIGMAYLIVMALAVSTFLLAIPELFAQTQKPAATPKQAASLEAQLYQAALKEKELNWWDQNSLEEAGAFMTEFNKRYPGIKINYFEGTQDVITERYLSESKAGRATADTIQPEPYRPLQEQGLLLDISDIIKDANYPPQFCTKELTGATLTHGVFGLGYNTRLIPEKDLPQSWEALLDPKWKGKINVERRLKTFVYGTEHWGEQWVVNYLKKLREQKPTFSKGHTQVATLLSVGEFSIAIGHHLHRTLLMEAEGAPVGFLPLKPAMHNAGSPHSIPKTAPHPNAAKLFYRWWMSPEGQAVNDKVRMRGSPLPGTGTAQAKFLEKHGVPVFSCTMWAIENSDRLEQIYAEAIGLKKAK